MAINISITIISPVDCFGIAKTADLCWIANETVKVLSKTAEFDKKIANSLL